MNCRLINVSPASTLSDIEEHWKLKQARHLLDDNSFCGLRDNHFSLFQVQTSINPKLQIVHRWMNYIDYIDGVCIIVLYRAKCVAHSAHTLQFNPLQPVIQNGRHKRSFCINLKKFSFAIFFLRSVVLEVNRLTPRSGPTYVGPDLGSSLFAIVQKYWWISIPSAMG